jgi:hypothetical protein
LREHVFATEGSLSQSRDASRLTPALAGSVKESGAPKKQGISKPFCRKFREFTRILKLIRENLCNPWLKLLFFLALNGALFRRGLT